MKDTFFHLPKDKKNRIIESCVLEFAEFGYDKGSTDRIIKRADISKGGLYEYIESKAELYLYLVEHAYQQLYSYIQTGIARKKSGKPGDILERFQLVSSIAIDFYIEHPALIQFIVKIGAITNPELIGKAQAIFLKQFMDVFGDVDTETLQYDKGQILDLLRWLLIKTRNDFLTEIERNNDIEAVKKAYFDEWIFYLKVLKSGIYK